MGNIQKEISQLEHWLLTLPEEAPISSFGGDSNSHTLMRLCSVVEKLAEQLNVQQITLNNIIDRLDVLKDIQEEGHMRDTSDEPWLDGAGEPIRNDIIEGDLLEPVYIVTKKDETSVNDTESVKPPSIHPGIPDEDTVIPDIDSVVEEAAPVEVKSEVAVEAKLPADEAKLPDPPVDKKEIKPEPVEEVEVEEEVEEEVEVEEEEEEEVEEEVVEEEEVEEEEEEEEEGQAFEEIEFKGKMYYRDEEGFIYTIDEDEQPSENPVGVWKEKTQSVAFYKTK
jgi:hypothetical protein